MAAPTSQNEVTARKLSDTISGLWGKIKDTFQTKLTGQTAYSAKGTATKVPQITTNALGQVTGITEVTITGVTPTSHASSATTYGVGTTSNYGHVKLVTGDMNGATHADGVACSKNHTHSQYLTSHQTVDSAMSSTSTNPVQNKVVNSALGNKAPLASPALTGTPTAPTAAAGTNTTQIATTAFVKQAVTDGLATADAMIYKGTIDGGSTGSYGALTAAASKGWTYKVTTAGKIDGVAVEIGDMLICNTDSTAAATSSNYSTIAANWDFVQANIDGAVTGPASVTSGNVAAFDGTTGKVIKDSGFTIAKSVPSDAKFTDTTYTFDGTYNASTNKAATVSTVTNAIGALDVSNISGFGAGKTLSALSETDGKISASFQNISITKSQVSDFPTSMTPTSHASSATTYGVGTTSNYGHVKLVTGDLKNATATDGCAASNSHTHSQYLTSHQTVDSALSSTSTNPVQNKVVNSALSGKQATLPTSGSVSGTYYVNIAGNAETASHSSAYGYTKLWASGQYSSSKPYALLADKTVSTTTNWGTGWLFKIEAQSAYAIFKINLRGDASSVYTDTTKVLVIESSDIYALSTSQLDKIIKVTYSYTAGSTCVVRIYTDMSYNGTHWQRVTLRQLDNQAGDQSANNIWEPVNFYKNDNNTNMVASVTGTVMTNDYTHGSFWGNAATATTASACSGNAATATSAGKLTTARKTYVTLGTASTTTTRDWSGDTTIPVSGTLAIANGGTNATTAAAARSNLGAAASTHTHGKDVVGGTDYSIEIANTDTSPAGWISVVEVNSTSSNYKSVLVRGKLIIGNGNWSQVYDSEMEFQAVLVATSPTSSCLVATPFYKSSGGYGSTATYVKASPSDYIRIARSSSNNLELQVNFGGQYNRYAVHYTVQSDISYVANTTVKAGMSSPAATIAPTYDYCAGKVLGTGGNSTTPVYVDSSGCVKLCSTMTPAIASQTSFDMPVVLGGVGGTPQAASYIRYYSDSNNGHILALGDSDATPKYSNNYSSFRFKRGTQKYTELRSANSSSTNNILYLPTNPGRLGVTLSEKFGYNSSTQWYKLAEFAASDSGNASCLDIKGICGGWSASDHHEFSLAIGIRGSVMFDYTVLSGTFNTIIKFVLAKNTDNSYTLYIRVDAGQYGKFALTAIPGPNVSVVYDGTSVAFSGTVVADSGTDANKKYVMRSSGSALAIANGGTGATTAAAARGNLDVYSKSEVNTAVGGARSEIQGRFVSRRDPSFSTSGWDEVAMTFDVPEFTISLQNDDSTKYIHIYVKRTNTASQVTVAGNCKFQCVPLSGGTSNLQGIYVNSSVGYASWVDIGTLAWATNMSGKWIITGTMDLAIGTSYSVHVDVSFIHENNASTVYAMIQGWWASMTSM